MEKGPWAMTGDLYVLTRVTDDSDPLWDERFTIYGTPERIKSMFDLSKGVPFGWQLLKGKAARRFLRNMVRDELRYQRERATT